MKKLAGIDSGKMTALLPHQIGLLQWENTTEVEPLIKSFEKLRSKIESSGAAIPDELAAAYLLKSWPESLSTRESAFRGRWPKLQLDGSVRDKPT